MDERQQHPSFNRNTVRNLLKVRLSNCVPVQTGETFVGIACRIGE
jgi:hypothetical protein